MLQRNRTSSWGLWLKLGVTRVLEHKFSRIKTYNTKMGTYFFVVFFPVAYFGFSLIQNQIISTHFLIVS